MKTLIPILIGLLVVGCGKSNQTANESNNTPAKPATTGKKVETNGDNGKPEPIATSAKPTKEQTLEEKVVGTYECKIAEHIYKYVFLKSGAAEHYRDGQKDSFEGNWTIVDKEVHGQGPNGKLIFRINSDGSLTGVAEVRDGKRKDSRLQLIFIKINVETKETPSKGDDNNSTTAKPVKELTKEDVVGTYEGKYLTGATLRAPTLGIETPIAGKTGLGEVPTLVIRAVFLENGIIKVYDNGKKEDESKWKITKEGKIHETTADGFIVVYRINPNSSITYITHIDKDGERTDLTKEEQLTLKKIK